MLGRLGTIGAIGYGGYQLINAGLETYAQSRALGISALNSEHGTGWGFEQKLGQAEMSLSPFISQEEAAQIYSAAIDQGWASRKGGFAQGNFSSAVNFMYGAAVDYNMSPQMSAQLLQTNSLGAGESVAALSEQLLTLKKTLDGTGVSMDAATSSFTSFTSSLISGGASPGDAALIATGAIKSFSGNTYLAGGAGVAQIQNAMSSSRVQAIVGGLTGHLPGAAFAGTNVQGGLAAYQGLLHQLAVEYSRQTGIGEEDRAAQFMVAYQSLTGQQIDLQTAKEMMMEAAADPNFVTRGQRDVKSTLGPLEHQNWAQATWHGLDWNIFSFKGLEGEQNDPGSINAHQYYNEKINNLLLSAGDQLSKYKLYGPGGRPVNYQGHQYSGAEIAQWFADPNNYNLFNNPSGGYYIQGPDGNRYDARNIGLGGSNAGVTGSGSTAANTVYITLSEQAKQYFAVDRTQLNLSDGKN